MSQIRIRIDWRMVLLFCLGIGWIIATRLPDTRPLLQTRGTRIPALLLTLPDGTPRDITTVFGTPTIVTIWASWCPTCRASMPFWERNIDDFRHKGVTLIALNHRESLDAVHHALPLFSPDLMVWSDPDGLFMQFVQSTDLPTTVFIDRRGHVVSVVHGPVSSAVVTTMVDQLTSE